MKIFKIFFFCFLVTSIISCSSSDDSTQAEVQNPVEPSIVETWTLTGLITTINSTTTSPLGDISTSLSEGKGSNINVTVTFSENPNIATTTGSYSIELTTDYGNGQIITQTFNDLNLTNLVGEWVLTDDQLTIQTPLNNTINATITSLTENNLSYDSVLEEVFTDSNNNDVVNIINQTYTYSR